MKIIYYSDRQNFTRESDENEISPKREIGNSPFISM